MSSSLESKFFSVDTSPSNGAINQAISLNKEGSRGAGSLGSRFFSVHKSPSNWAINQAVHLNKEGSLGAARGMMVVSSLFGPISSGKNLANFVVKLPVTIFAATAGQVPAVKERVWTKLEVVSLVAATLAKTLLNLAIHVYKFVMFLTFSPICNLTVGMISPEAAKKAHDWLKLTPPKESSEEKKPTAAPKPEAVATPAVPLLQLPAVNNPTEQNNTQPKEPEQQGGADLGNQGKDPAQQEQKNDNTPAAEGNIPPPPPLPTGLLSPRKIQSAEETAIDTSQGDTKDKLKVAQQDKPQDTGHADALAAAVAKAEQKHANSAAFRRLSLQFRKEELKKQQDQKSLGGVANLAMFKFAEQAQDTEEEEFRKSWESLTPEAAARFLAELEALKKQEESANQPIGVQAKPTDRPLPVPGQPKTPVTEDKTEQKTPGTPNSPSNTQSPTGALTKSQKKKAKKKAKKAGVDQPTQAAPQPTTTTPAQVSFQEPAKTENKAQDVVSAPAPAKQAQSAIPEPTIRGAARKRPTAQVVFMSSNQGVVEKPVENDMQKLLRTALIKKNKGAFGTMGREEAKEHLRKTQAMTQEEIDAAFAEYSAENEGK